MKERDQVDHIDPFHLGILFADPAGTEVERGFGIIFAQNFDHPDIGGILTNMQNVVARQLFLFRKPDPFQKKYAKFFHKLKEVNMIFHMDI